MQFSDTPAPYAPTFRNPDTKFFNDHLALPEDHLLKEIYKVKTKICRNDALKLYEMAYFSNNILELGCFHGGSTFVLATACHDSKKGKITSVDLSSDAMPVAKQLIKQHNLDHLVEFHLNDSTKQLETFRKNNAQFDFAFIDHDHAYKSVFEACQILPDIIAPNGYALFHDYQDYRNAIPDSSIQVYHAVQDGLKDFKFVGLYGQSGLFQHK